MKHFFFYDDAYDKGQIDFLTQERDRLSGQVDQLQTQISSLQKLLSEAISNSVKLPTSRPATFTREAAAQRLGIPRMIFDQVDWERMGVQFEEPATRIGPLEAKKNA